MANNTVNFTVNGTMVTPRDEDMDLPLVDYLHEELQLTGTKFCCGIGVCRACTVLTKRAIEGDDGPSEVMLSCSTPLSQLNGLDITTVEGVASKESLHPLQQAMLEHFSFQCGYCTPGFLMASMKVWRQLEIKAETPEAIDIMVEQAIGPHICRCTGYIRYHQAIMKTLLDQKGFVL